MYNIFPFIVQFVWDVFEIKLEFLRSSLKYYDLLEQYYPLLFGSAEVSLYRSLRGIATSLHRYFEFLRTLSNP